MCIIQNYIAIHLPCIFIPFVLGTIHLRLLSEWLILIGSAMFGATFNLVTHVGLPNFFGTLKILV